MPGIKNIFGGAQFQHSGNFSDPATLLKVYAALEAADCHTVDTATIYGASEELLGQTEAGKRFTIDTKAPGGIIPGCMTKQGVQDFAQKSKQLLGIEQVDVWYLHAPDDSVPIEETLAGVNEVFKSGWFRRFGLSNFLAGDVQKVYDICEREGYPLPSVYQGDYSAIARKQEDVLFPTLRKLGISFYAYSPPAGGFLVKTAADILAGKGRFDPSSTYGAAYNKRFNKPCFLDALEKWAAVAQQEGTTAADLAYRWVKYNSPLKAENGDAIIIGATSLGQLEQTLEKINSGPVSEAAANAIEEVWEGVKDEAGLDLIHQ